MSAARTLASWLAFTGCAGALTSGAALAQTPPAPFIPPTPAHTPEPATELAPASSPTPSPSTYPSTTTPAAGSSATAPAAATAPATTAWQRCTALPDDAARLACFDQWAGQQAWQPAPTQSAAAAPAGSSPTRATTNAARTPTTAASPTPAELPPSPEPILVQVDGCRDTRYSLLARFWELEQGSSCGTLRFRGYRPISVSVVGANTVNDQPSSPAPGHAATPVNYRRTEMRLQLSVRTKLAQGLLTQDSAQRLDSLWFGYTQQSYWQLFSGNISRPFRNTDHEPEVVYVYPTDAQLPWGWRWRYSGVGLVHQSNGQSLPLSRSWNRIYLMTGVELNDRWSVSARLWRRLAENAADDDNPGISNYVGRAELQATWNPDQVNTVSTTLRNSFGSAWRGSARLEWLHTLGGRQSNLRLHTQLFSGYGDSLVDYNRKRTVLSLGVSLVDF